MSLILWEIWAYLHIPLYWYLFRKLAKRNVIGDIIAGTLVGLFIEFSTEPLWNYHFKFVLYKDVPLAVPLGWGMLLTLITFFSEKLYCWTLKKESVKSNDKRILIFDAVGAALIGFPLETMALKSGLWDYRMDILQWNWGTVPFFNMPYEALVGYMLLMLVAPSFLRHWREAFGSRSLEAIPSRSIEKLGRERKIPVLEEKSSADPASPAASLGS